VTAIVGLRTREAHARLLERERELSELDRLMRERGTLAGPDEPAPLHRPDRGTTERTTS
jgi:hypothetical protein